MYVSSGRREKQQGYGHVRFRHPWAAGELIASSFVLGMSDFVVVGILSDIAHGLRVSEVTVGNLVSLFAFVYAPMTPLGSALSARFPRFATTMNTEEPPLQALEQAIAWAASHGGTDGLAMRRRSWRAVHRHGVRRQGDGIRHAAVDRHGRRLLRRRHGRIRRRRVQDRARLAAQALP